MTIHVPPTGAGEAGMVTLVKSSWFSGSISLLATLKGLDGVPDLVVISSVFATGDPVSETLIITVPELQFPDRSQI